MSNGRFGISDGFTACVSNTTPIVQPSGSALAIAAVPIEPESAAAIVDDEGLAGLHRHLLRERTRDLIDRAAGREDDDDLDGLDRPALRGCGRSETRGERECKRDECVADISHVGASPTHVRAIADIHDWAAALI